MISSFILQAGNLSGETGVRAANLSWDSGVQPGHFSRENGMQCNGASRGAWHTGKACLNSQGLGYE